METLPLNRNVVYLFTVNMISRVCRARGNASHFETLTVCTFGGRVDLKNLSYSEKSWKSQRFSKILDVYMNLEKSKIPKDLRTFRNESSLTNEGNSLKDLLSSKYVKHLSFKLEEPREEQRYAKWAESVY